MTRVGEVALVGVGWNAGAVWWGAYQLTRLTRAAERYLRVLEALVQRETASPPDDAPLGLTRGGFLIK
jgi:hypothetical protein